MRLTGKLLICITVVCLGVIYAAEVTLKNGDKISGKVVSEDMKQITIVQPSGIEAKIPKTEVASVNYQATGTSTSPQAAQPVAAPAAARGAATHDGFFLRFLLGGGSMQFSESPVSNGTIKMGGAGAFFGFHIGFAAVENFILMASLNGYAASELRPELNGQQSTSTVNLSTSSYGAGFTYYVMPLNLYFSADFGAARDQITASGTKYDMEWGFGVNGQIGKEWWVSDNWGLGAAIFIHYSTMKDKTSSLYTPTITNLIVGVAFSATYN